MSTYKASNLYGFFTYVEFGNACVYEAAYSIASSTRFATFVYLLITYAGKSFLFLKNFVEHSKLSAVLLVHVNKLSRGAVRLQNCETFI